MKVISILQPWASLMVLGHKRIETRSWNTNYRGRLLIHASASKKGLKAIDVKMWDEFNHLGFNVDILPYGAIIGEATLVETFRFGSDRSIEYVNSFPKLEMKIEMMFGDWNEGRYGWRLENPIEFLTPEPAKGKLGIWDLI